MQDIRQSKEYANYLRREDWIVERIDNINYFIRRLPLIGSVLKLQRPRKIDYQSIDELVIKYRVFQIIIEPDSSSRNSTFDHTLLLHHGFKLSKSPYLPSKTLQIDLTYPINRLIVNMKKDTRRSIKIGKTLKVKEYSTPNEIKIFLEVWKNSVKFDRYVPSYQQLLNLRRSFPQSKSLFLASHNISGRIIGGVIFTTSSHGVSNYITYYTYGFTNKEGRASLSQYSLLYQGILWAKKHGYKLFDFEGIYDDRFPNKSWLGFSHFKKSFGGVEVLYPGCYTKFRLPI